MFSTPSRLPSFGVRNVGLVAGQGIVYCYHDHPFALKHQLSIIDVI
jgi:hypothetical protein